MNPTAVTRARTLLRRHTFVFALVLVLVLLAAALALQPNFNWPNQLAAFAPLAVAAMASTPSILSGRGGIDMSTSPVMTLSAIVFVGILVPSGLGGIEAVPIMMLFGGAIGTAMGCVIVFLRLSPIVVTLAAYFIIIGINLKLAPRSLQLGENWVTSLSGMFGPIPAALVSIAFPLLLWTALMATSYGRNLYAVGGNDATAYSAGVNVAAVRIMAFGIGSSFASLAGLVLVGLVRTADSSTSGSYTLVAIAAAALGGVSLTGGRGSLLGAALGAASIFLIQSVLSDLNMPQTWLPAVYGALLIGSVVLGAVLLGQRKGSRA